MRRVYVACIVLPLWIAAAVPVVQQIRETLFFQRFNREWAQGQDFALSTRFAGRVVETVEIERDGNSALVSVLVDGRVALPTARVWVIRDTNNLTRYHRWISQSRFRSLVRPDSVMLLGRLRDEDGEQVVDLLMIDKDGRLARGTNIGFAYESNVLKHRVLSQLSDEMLPALPYAHWSILEGFGGGFSGAYILGVLAPWVVLVVTSVVLLAMVAQFLFRKTLADERPV